MFKKILTIFFFFLLPWPVLAHGAEETREEIITAQVIEIINEKEIIKEDGSKIIQQNLKLQGLKGQWKNKIFTFEGVSDMEVINNKQYKKGDKVLVNYLMDDEGEAVEQLKLSNSQLTRREIFHSAFQIGNTHLGAAINTLFLTYAGAALPLLLLFSVKQPPFMSFYQVINSEMIATEIVRTLVGSIGIALALPLATIIATYSITNRKEVAV